MGSASFAIQVIEALNSGVVVTPVCAGVQVRAFGEMPQHGFVRAACFPTLDERALELLSRVDGATLVATDGGPNDEAGEIAVLLRGVEEAGKPVSGRASKT